MGFKTRASRVNLPKRIDRLNELSYNLWWTWSSRARALFNTIDSRAWSLYRNPVQLLINFDRTHWQTRLEDETFVAAYRQVTQAFERYMDAGGKVTLQQVPYKEVLVTAELSQKPPSNMDTMFGGESNQPFLRICMTPFDSAGNSHAAGNRS